MEVFDCEVLGVIPARYQSSRFPGKPLASILGKTLIQRTYENAARCEELDALVVATDDARIASHVQSFGGHVVMTKAACRSGTERCAEAAKHFPKAKKIVNIQGDEPCLEPEVISAVASHPGTMVTAATPLRSSKEAFDPGVVKCVFDLEGRALYFTRSPLPHGMRHLGIYGFEREHLLRFPELASTPLQEAEDLEQLRALEHGWPIHVCVVADEGMGVDTPEDLKALEKLLCNENTSLSQAALSPL